MIEYHRLPYTGDRVPASMADLEIRITGEMQSREGVAFNAEVRKLTARSSTVLGIIENQGNGGGTWFVPYDPSARKWWQEMVEAFKPVIAEDEPEYGESFAEESLADRLYENAALYRDLNRKRSVVIRVNGDNDQIFVYKGTWDARMATHFAAEARKGKTIERWIKNQGWEHI